ncbi:hypothetical protein AGMMS49960_21450 [Betaproteobacteria bacterium]|nr:hypothetical protein AGMMS49543_22250 [Betaproteobacteria bacterium]GHU05102.1 hypothetical protein AGMMS49960_21450 [Betaproteobacteria bacterium]GHU23067.1 hypothetical protein AGMMS50243_23820 [Betaproteobacteria bacterium]
MSMSGRGGKTLAAKREVPLSPEVVRLLQQLSPSPEVFDLGTSATVGALFRKAKKKAGIVDLHFHDARLAWRLTGNNSIYACIPTRLNWPKNTVPVGDLPRRHKIHPLNLLQ